MTYLSIEHRPQLLGIPEQGGMSTASEPELLAVKTESFFSSFSEPHSGHFASFRQSLERTSCSESLEQSRQENS